MIKFLANYLAYILILGWLFYSIINLRRYKTSNPYLLQLIPSIFTTIGVFGTFLGITYGLYHFNENDITGSIPELLKGMKVAFLTSILGISLSIVFSNILAWLKRKMEDEIPPKPTSELQALQKLIEVIENSEDKNVTLKERLIQGLTDNNNSINDLNKQNQLNTDKFNTEIQAQFKLSNDLRNNHQNNIVSYTELINKNLITLNENLEILKTEQSHTSKIANQNTEKIILSMTKNNQLIQDKFDEFSVLLAKNNTEALVLAMERVITDFNKKMNSLIQKLVQENFQELNNSVKKLNEWQIENKVQVEKLINQFKEVSSNLVSTSSSIKEITINTEKLTTEEGYLAELIEELQSVMIKDTKFKTLIDKVSETVITLKSTTDEFDNTTNALNKWVREERNIKKSVITLLSKMQELDKIKSYDNQFWKDTKLKMEEGVSIIERANKKLSTDVKTIDAQFYNRLNTTLQSLDQLIQQFILNSNKRR